MIRNNSDSLWHLNAGSFAKPTANTTRLDMGLFEIANLYGNGSQWTGASTYAAGFTLKGQTQAFINMGMPHLYIFKNIFPCAFDRLQGASRTGISAFHTQDAGLLTWGDVGRSHGGNTFFKTKILNAIVWAHLGALPTANTTTQKFILRQGPGRTEKTHAIDGNPVRCPGSTGYG